MVDCNIFKCANVLLIVNLFFFLAVAFSDASPSDKIEINDGLSPVERNDMSLDFVAKINDIKKNGNKKTKSYGTKLKTTTVPIVLAARVNLLAVGGIINLVVSLLNLFFALLNFYFIFGRYNLRLRQIASKVKISVEEIGNRDMHPKIKMSMSRCFPPDGPLLGQVMQLLKEPSNIFDNANGLLDGQKEARLRKTTTHAAQSTTKPSATPVAKSSSNSTSKSIQKSDKQKSK